MPRKSPPPPPPAATSSLRAWPADSVERWPLARIVPYEHNARTHSPEQVRQIAESMQRFGVTAPLLVDEDGVLIFGHGRRAAAELLGYAELPVSVARGWTEDEKRAYRLADNQLAAASEWDLPTLSSELRALSATGFGLGVIGFPEADLRRWNILPPVESAPDPEWVPAPPPRPTVRAGDIWHLGGHRLICGDATDPETWRRLFGGERAAMVFTDPPYGVSYEASSGDFAVIAGDDKRQDDLFKMLARAFRAMVKHAADGAGFYIWHASATRADFEQAMTAAGLIERQYLIWAKPNIGLGHTDYRWAHEPCFYASKAERSPAFYGQGQSTVWHVAAVATDQVASAIGPGVLILDGAGASLWVTAKVPKTKKVRQIRLTDDRPQVHLTGDNGGDGTVWEVARERDYEHPTQKPVELARRAIENSSRAGEIVADAFAGSGTTVIGAEMTGRRAYAIELDPVYAQVVVERWQRFSGHAATLDGATFTDVARARASEGAKSPKAAAERAAGGRQRPSRRRAPTGEPQPAPAPAAAPAAE